MNNLEILKNFDILAEELHNNPATDEYWIEEEQMMEKRRKRNEAFNKSIEMSYEKFHTPFTI